MGLTRDNMRTLVREYFARSVPSGSSQAPTFSGNALDAWVTTEVYAVLPSRQRYWGLYEVVLTDKGYAARHLASHLLNESIRLQAFRRWKAGDPTPSPSDHRKTMRLE